jgi:hypothetical protein
MVKVKLTIADDAIRPNRVYYSKEVFEEIAKQTEAIQIFNNPISGDAYSELTFDLDHLVGFAIRQEVTQVNGLNCLVVYAELIGPPTPGTLPTFSGVGLSRKIDGTHHIYDFRLQEIYFIPSDKVTFSCAAVEVL